MTWSVSAHGNTAVVRAALAQQFRDLPRTHPVHDLAEKEQIKSVEALLDQTLAVFGARTGVMVTANGTESGHNGQRWYGLEVKIVPMWNWS